MLGRVDEPQARRDTLVPHYGLDIHGRHTNYCVVDDSGAILKEGRCSTDELPLDPRQSCIRAKRPRLICAAQRFLLVSSAFP